MRCFVSLGRQREVCADEEEDDDSEEYEEDSEEYEEEDDDSEEDEEASSEEESSEEEESVVSEYVFAWVEETVTDASAVDVLQQPSFFLLTGSVFASFLNGYNLLVSFRRFSLPHMLIVWQAAVSLGAAYGLAGLLAITG